MTEVPRRAVQHVADLARIDLDEEELDRLAEEFADILEYFETLDEVPETESEPRLVNVMRTDDERACLEQGEAMGNAPETEDGYFKGPPVS